MSGFHLTNRARALGAAAVAAFALAVVPGESRAQSGNVDVDITIGGITILYYVSDVDVTLDATAIAGLMNVSGCTAGANGFACNSGALAGGSQVATYNAAADQFEIAGSFTPAPAPDTAITNVPLLLNDVWAVRAVGGTSANTTVGVALGASTVLNSQGGTGTITLVSAGPAADTFADPGLGTPRFGDVTLNLDLSGVRSGGLYSTTASDTADVNYVVSITGT